MQPGSTHCPGGWANEYSGYIMSSPSATRRSEYVCVDTEPEASADSDATDNNAASPRQYAAQLAPVEISMDATGNTIEDYTEYNELMCAVCAKPSPITLDKLSISTNNKFNPSSARENDRILLELTSSRSIKPPRVVIAGRNATVAGGGNRYFATIATEADDEQGIVEYLVAELEDLEVEGNVGLDVSITTDDTFVFIDTVAPSLSTIVFSSDNSNNRTVTIGQMVRLSFNATEPLQLPVASIGNSAAFVEAILPSADRRRRLYNGGEDVTMYVASVEASVSWDEGPVSFEIWYRDSGGNEGTMIPGMTTDGSKIDHDFTPPVATDVSVETTMVTVKTIDVDGLFGVNVGVNNDIVSIFVSIFVYRH
jgi:hypothetical protein